MTTDYAENQEEKQDAKVSADYWRRWLKASKAAAKQHFKDARIAWDEYEKKELEQGADGWVSSEQSRSKRTYPLYWSACKTIEPAFYSRTPKVSTKRRLGVDSPAAVLASQSIERLADFLVDQTNFDEALLAAVQDFIHADKTTVQISYDAEFEEQEQRIQLQPANDATFVTEDGQLFEDEVFQDEQGFFGIQIIEVPVKQEIHLMPLPYDSVIHTPDARYESEIKEKAYEFCLSKEEAEKRFGKDICKLVKWHNNKGEEYDEHDTEAQAPGKYIKGWEIYDKKTLKVHWVSEQYHEFILDSKDDPYGLHSFFPSPTFQIGSKPRATMYPTPAYLQVKEHLDNIHSLTARVFKLSDSIRRRAIVDGGDDDLIAALNSLEDAEFIASSNLTNLLEKGGLEGSIYWIPVQELVQALSELLNLKETFNNEFYDLFGVPDILRGSSDPIETATAQTIKERSAHDRFKYMKKQIAVLASDAIQMMVDLALGTFTAEKIAEIVGVQYMDQADQALWPEAYQILTNDETRLIQIDIDTDALTFIDEQVRANQMNQTVGTVMSGLQTVSEMLKDGGDPAMGAVGLKAVLLSLDVLSPGKEFQQGIRHVAESMLEQLENPPPPAPPPPDYEGMKLEIQNQKLMLDMQKMQMENQTKQLDLQITTQLESQKQLAQQELDAAKLRLQAESQMFEQEAESRYLELETYRATLEELRVKFAQKESLMEELRLARQADVENLMRIIEAQRSDVETATTRPVTVNLVVPKSRKRTGRIVGDGQVQLDNPQVEYQTIQQQIPQGQTDMELRLPEVVSRTANVQYDENDNPTLTIDELLGGLE